MTSPAAPGPGKTPARLRKRRDFLAAAKGGRFHGKAFSLQDLARDDAGPARAGFTVTKKAGRATKRNRIRRRLKEALRLMPEQPAKAGHDYVFVARTDALTMGFAAIQSEISRAFARTGQNGKGPPRPRARPAPAQDRTERT